MATYNTKIGDRVSIDNILSNVLFLDVLALLLGLLALAFLEQEVDHLFAYLSITGGKYSWVYRTYLIFLMTDLYIIKHRIMKN